MYLDYPKTYKNEIRLNIPEGYVVSDISTLNVNVDNESGSFISTAKIVADKLIVNTTKTYKKSDDQVSNWLNYVEFTDAGYNFSQTKILITKE